MSVTKSCTGASSEQTDIQAAQYFLAATAAEAAINSKTTAPQAMRLSCLEVRADTARSCSMSA